MANRAIPLRNGCSGALAKIERCAASSTPQQNSPKAPTLASSETLTGRPCLRESTASCGGVIGVRAMNARVPSENAVFDPEQLGTLYRAFDAAWEIVKQQYVVNEQSNRGR
jgi:hypothetical protein